MPAVSYRIADGDIQPQDSQDILSVVVETIFAGGDIYQCDTW